MTRLDWLAPPLLLALAGCAGAPPAGPPQTASEAKAQFDARCAEQRRETGITATPRVPPRRACAREPSRWIRRSPAPTR